MIRRGSFERGSFLFGKKRENNFPGGPTSGEGKKEEERRRKKRRGFGREAFGLGGRCGMMGVL